MKTVKADALQQYVQLRDALLKEKGALEARLAHINKALGGGAEALVRTAFGPGRKRAKNKMSLKEAVIQAITSKALTKPEILEAIKANGYKFATKNPMNSLNVLLYSGKTFKKVEGGKFSVAK